MSITQSLSDIQVMLKYVEGLIKEKDDMRDTDSLSSIGQNTLEIINRIDELNSSLTSLSDDVLTKHSETLEKNSDITKESLLDLIQRIEENEHIQKDMHVDIQDIFTKYDRSVNKVMSYMTNNKKYQEKIVDGLSKQMTEINEGIDNINNKTLSRDDMASIMQDINERLHMIINTDADINNKNQVLLESINENLETAKTWMSLSSGKLQSIKLRSSESASRLSLIDTKIDTITKYIMREE